MGADREWIVGSLGSKNGLMALEGTSTNTHKSSLTRGDYLGRAPWIMLRSWKSVSFVTMIKWFPQAWFQTSASVAQPSPSV